MKKICINCKSSEMASDDLLKASVDFRAKLEDIRINIRGKGPRAQAREVAAKEYSGNEVALSETMIQKGADPEWFVCSNADHIKEVADGKKGVAHKYYFSCPFFEEKD